MPADGASYRERIAAELAAAREAEHAHNDGKARVCSRRAAGVAIGWLLTKHPQESWGTDAITRLHHVQSDSGFPQEIRAAAMRLSARISQQFTYPSTTSPVDDAETIVTHVFTLMSDGSA